MNPLIFVKGLIAHIEDATGLVHAVETHAPLPSTADLLAYKPTSQQDALDHLGKLQTALQQATTSEEVGKILVAIGGIIDGFFPQYQQEAQFLITLGEALESGKDKGTVGPVRLGNIGITVSWAPWQGADAGVTPGDVLGGPTPG